MAAAFNSSISGIPVAIHVGKLGVKKTPPYILCFLFALFFNVGTVPLVMYEHYILAFVYALTWVLAIVVFTELYKTNYAGLIVEMGGGEQSSSIPSLYALTHRTQPEAFWKWKGEKHAVLPAMKLEIFLGDWGMHRQQARMFVQQLSTEMYKIWEQEPALRNFTLPSQTSVSKATPEGFTPIIAGLPSRMREERIKDKNANIPKKILWPVLGCGVLNTIGNVALDAKPGQGVLLFAIILIALERIYATYYTTLVLDFDPVRNVPSTSLKVGLSSSYMLRTWFWQGKKYTCMPKEAIEKFLMGLNFSEQQAKDFCTDAETQLRKAWHQHPETQHQPFPDEANPGRTRVGIVTRWTKRVKHAKTLADLPGVAVPPASAVLLKKEASENIEKPAPSM